MKQRCQESVPLLGPWLDGELREEDRLWLEEHVGCCPTCTARKALLEAQRDALREAVVRRAADADLSALADAVLSRVLRDPEPARLLRIRVWGTEMWRAHRTRISAGAALAVAACLAVVAIVAPRRSGDPAATLLAARMPGASVDEVDFENHEGAVLQAGQTTVIWVDDHGPEVPQ
jgi:anti-sigma factor RsiW